MVWISFSEYFNDLRTPVGLIKNIKRVEYLFKSFVELKTDIINYAAIQLT